MSGPTNKQDLQRFMGMLAYLSKFIPNMAEESAPLRRLLEKNVQWHWSDEHKKSLDSLKTLLTKTPVLKYYEEAIVTKPLYRAPIRLQRMLLRLQQYDISVVHKHGKQMYIADALSRATNSTQECKDGDTATDDIFHVHIILPATQEKLNHIQNATEKDPELQVLLRVLFVLHFIHFLRSILIKLLQNICSLSFRFKSARLYR